MASFKVDDGVWQVKKTFLSLNFNIFVVKDILTLQLIRLFHNIFEQEGLELYLYTYRVIVTNPGVCEYFIRLKKRFLLCSVGLLNMFRIDWWPIPFIFEPCRTKLSGFLL